MAATRALVLAAFFALSRLLAAAGCQTWDVSGSWFIQTGAGDHNFHLTQRGSSLTGLATQGTARSSKVTGNVMGSSFYLHVVSKGFELRGEIHDDGKIHGVVHDLSNLRNKAVFVSSRPMRCMDRPTTPPPQSSKAVEDQRKQIQDAHAQAQNAATATPRITATPATVTIPTGQTTGTTTLTWDAGKDHPYAELWVKVDDGEETFVVEQGKGSRRVTVEPGRSYLYFITDSGRRLATVTVRAR